jgi:hypothetical protein
MKKYNNMEKTLLDRFHELKEDCLDFISNKVLNGKQSGSLNINNGINTLKGKVDRIEVDSAGCYVNINGEPKKLRGLQNEVIIQIASYLEGSWNGE